MLQRFAIDWKAEPGPKMTFGRIDCDDGPCVLFTDAEADKAEAVAEAVASTKAKEPGICAICEKEIFWHAFEHDGRPGSWQHGGDFGFDHKATPRGEAEVVAEKTKELRAELVTELEDVFQYGGAYRTSDGWWRVSESRCATVEKLVRLKAWERRSGSRKGPQFYRPVEPQDSGPQ